MWNHRRANLASFWLLLIASTFIQADEIKVGMTTALSGPAEALGKNMKLGIGLTSKK